MIRARPHECDSPDHRTGQDRETLNGELTRRGLTRSRTRHSVSSPGHSRVLSILDLLSSGSKVVTRASDEVKAILHLQFPAERLLRLRTLSPRVLHRLGRLDFFPRRSPPEMQALHAAGAEESAVP